MCAVLVHNQQASLAEAVRNREWDRAHALQQYAANAERSLIAKLSAFYQEYGQIKINASNVAQQVSRLVGWLVG